MTAFISRNATEETIGLIQNNADMELTEWIQGLAKEYSSIEAKIYDLGNTLVPRFFLMWFSWLNRRSGADSDYSSWTRQGFPAAFASEGNPTAGGFPGDFDPYVHTVKDTMDVDNEKGVFSLEVSDERHRYLTQMIDFS